MNSVPRSFLRISFVVLVCFSLFSPSLVVPHLQVARPAHAKDQHAHSLTPASRSSAAPLGRINQQTFPNQIYIPFLFEGSASEPSQLPDPSQAPERTVVPTLAIPDAQIHYVGDAVFLSLNATHPTGESIRYQATELPPGLSIDEETGQIAGRPTQAGIFSVTIRVEDENGHSNNATFGWAVYPKAAPQNANAIPHLNVPVIPPSRAGQAVYLTLTASDSDGDALAFFATGLPDGLSLLSTRGEISGIPTKAGRFETSIGVDDGNGGRKSTVFIWVIDSDTTANTPPTVSNPGSQTATVGDAVRLNIGANDPDGERLTFEATGLPLALYLNKEDGVIEGNLASSGTFSATVTARDGAGGSDSALFQWTVLPSPAVESETPATNQAPTIEPLAPRTNIQGENVFMTVGASDADGNTLTYSVKNLPTGLSMSESGQISGTLTTVGTFTATVTIEDSHGGLISTEFVWIVEPTIQENRPPILTHPAAPLLLVGERLFLTVGAVDPDGDRLSYSAAGLPEGLALSGPIIQGILTQPGEFPITVTAEDGRGGSDDVTFLLSVSPPPILNRAPTLVNPGDRRDTVNDSVFLSIGAYDADGDRLTYSATNLPPGLEIDGSSGLIQGMLSAAGLFTPTITVDDGSTQENSRTSVSFSWQVNESILGNQAPELTAPEKQIALVGEAVSLTIQAVDQDNDVLSFSAVGLPDGLSIDSATGQISGVPTINGVNEIAIIVEDGKGGNDAVTFQWIIEDNRRGDGTILLEKWANISGSIEELIANTNYPQNPDQQSLLDQFELVASVANRSLMLFPTDIDEHYGARLRGYLYPPVTGEYTFWIAGDEVAELWLSMGEEASNAVRIAYTPAATSLRHWDQFPQQQSTTIFLEAGQRVYIESRHAESTGDDHVSVAWQIPSQPREVIRGQYLSAIAPNVAAGKTASQSSTRQNAPEWAAYHAVDGVGIDGDGSTNSILQARTKNESQPWWQVDLGAVYDIESVRLWNHDGSLGNVEVLVSETPFRIDEQNSTQAAATSLTIRSNSSTQPIFFEVNQPGRFVQVRLLEEGSLRLDEVEIFALPQANTVIEPPLPTVAIDVIGDPNALEKTGQRATVRLRRDVALGAVTVPLTFLGAIDPTNGSAQRSDFELLDESNNLLAEDITFAPFQFERAVTIKAIDDELREVPEMVRLQIQPSPVEALNPYTVSSGADVASVMLLDDAPGVTRESTLFVAAMSAEGQAQTTASGMATIRLSNDNSYGLVNLNFHGLTTVQTAAHIHYADPESGPVIFSIPLGQVTGEKWLIEAAHLASTDQRMLNALFAGKLYINVHSGRYPAGEIRGTAQVPSASGEFQPPPAAPAYEQLRAVDQRRDIVRFLNQATFGPTPELIAELDAKIAAHGGDRIAAYGAWLDEQMTIQSPSMLDFVEAHYQMWISNSFTDTVMAEEERVKAIKDGDSRRSGLYNSWFTSAVYAKAQLRERMAWALSEILVISNQDGTLGGRPWLSASYYDVLKQNAFAPYDELLYDVSVHPAMGHYLSSIKNRMTRYDRDGNLLSSPDENYAREIMQLFSIGLLELHPDGSLRLGSSGLPIETYNQTDITELARIFTGWSYAVQLADLNDPNSAVENSEFYFGGYEISNATKENFSFYQPHLTMPMKMFEDNGKSPDEGGYTRYHDNGEKVVLGQVFAAERSGMDEMQDVASMLANHNNTGVYLSYRLIQRLVKSNPSAGYIYRVAQAYTNSNGHMGQVVKAILLDPEARNLNGTETVGAGKVKEYLYHYTSVLRTLDARSAYSTTHPIAKLVDFGYAASELDLYESDAHMIYTRLWQIQANFTIRQAPLNAPSVFNWFLPDYAPTGPIAQAGLVAPEIQHVTAETTVALYNLLYELIHKDGTKGNEPQWNMDRALVTPHIPQWLRSAYMSVLDTNGDGEVTVADSGGIQAGGLREATSALVDVADDYLCAGQLKAFATGDVQTDPRQIIIDSVEDPFLEWDYQPNLATRAIVSATQSSDNHDGYAELAIDGYVHGNYSDGSVTHTGWGRNSWWSLDLGQVETIQTIRLWNRVGCCEDRLSNFHILISDVPFASTDLDETIAQSAVTNIYVEPIVEGHADFAVNRSGRYIRIQLADRGVLSLAEVQVYGPDPQATHTGAAVDYNLEKIVEIREARIKEALYLISTAPQCLMLK